MTAEISFYHLISTKIDKALPQLLDKAISSGKKSLVLVSDSELETLIDTSLWNYRKNFLPHGFVKDPKPHRQPILITSELTELNKPDFVFVANNQLIPNDFLSQVSKVFDLFSSESQSSIANARERFRHYKNLNIPLNYWKQQANGTWENVA